jgi:hypothetical protein
MLLRTQVLVRASSFVSYPLIESKYIWVLSEPEKRIRKKVNRLRRLSVFAKRNFRASKEPEYKAPRAEGFVTVSGINIPYLILAARELARCFASTPIPKALRGIPAFAKTGLRQLSNCKGYQSRCLALAGLVACLCYASPAKADTPDPFNMDGGHWMSFDHYSDNLKRNRPVGNETPGEAPVKIEVPALDVPAAAKDEKPAANAAPAATLAGEPVPSGPAVATMTRPLNLPILPGVNKGYGLKVSSTLDNNNPTAPAQIVSTDNGASDMHLQEQNWQNATEAARPHAGEEKEDADSNQRLPLDVRMTFLPNPKIIQATQSQHKPRAHIAELPSTPKPAPTNAQAQQAVVACTAALDAYKKKEIEAIKSDRQTLQALQSAIADLGLQKELNFIAGAQQSSTLSAPQKN